MRLPFYSACSIVFFVLFETSATIRINVDIFVNTILDVRKFYSAASVIFVHPGDIYGGDLMLLITVSFFFVYEYVNVACIFDLLITHLIHTSSRLLNRRYIITADVHFKKLWETIRYYHQISPPINVVIIPNFEAYLEFAEATKTYPMSFPVWLTLFFYTPDNSTHDHCHQPIGNLFNLAFDTHMLVLCHNEAILREWYSVKGDTVKIFDLAEKKSDETGFILLTNLPFYVRRNDMEGVVLRAVVIKDLSVRSKFAGNYVATMYRKVIEELTHSLNFTLKIVSQMTEHGVLDRNTLNWSGVMGEITSGRADLAIADMSLTSLRTYYVDFMMPLIASEIKLYIKKPEICSVKWFGYFQTFSSRTWTTIIILMMITSLFLFFMKPYRESRSAVDFIENFICIWGIFCQQALKEFPKSSSLRIAYFTIFLTAVLILAHYSAGLISFLTSCTYTLPFQTLDEFVNDGTYKLIVPRGTSNYDEISFQAEYQANSFAIKLMKLLKDESELPRSIWEGFMQVCKEGNIAYMIQSSLKKNIEKEIPCKLLSISTEKIDNLAMILSKDNPYTDVINYHLQKFLDNGMLRRLRETYSSKLDEDKIYNSVHLINVTPILVILCGGFIISTIILIIEKIHSFRSRRRKFSSRIFYPSKKLFIKKYNI